jgi:hypothetical protein
VENEMLVTKTSVLSGVTRTMDMSVTSEQLCLWRGGMLIQDAMPNLSADEREFLMTGITPDEWDDAFGDET